MTEDPGQWLTYVTDELPKKKWTRELSAGALPKIKLQCSSVVAAADCGAPLIVMSETALVDIASTAAPLVASRRA